MVVSCEKLRASIHLAVVVLLLGIRRFYDNLEMMLGYRLFPHMWFSWLVSTPLFTLVRWQSHDCVTSALVTSALVFTASSHKCALVVNSWQGAVECTSVL